MSNATQYYQKVEKMKDEQSITSGEKEGKTVFRALRHRNFRLFFVGQGISLIGTWMQLIAMSWLVYRLTNSVFLLGLIGFTGQIPSFFLAPIAGVYVDRVNRHRLLIVTQTLSMIQAMILAFLVFTGAADVWHIILLSITLGLINAFDMPGRQAFTYEMVDDKRDLGNAIALNSTLITSARLIGPAIAGILIAIVGEGMCFLINGLSFIAVIVALLAMKITPQGPRKKEGSVFAVLKESFTYTFGFLPARYIILLLALTSLMGMPYTTLMPVFAKDILHGGPDTLGFLMGAAGLGALVGAVYLVWKKSFVDMGIIIPIGAGIFGAGLIAFSLSNFLPLSLVLILITNIGFMTQATSSNTHLQHLVHDDKRGRVMAFFTMAFMGTVPIGSLLEGTLAESIGTPNTLIIGGAFCILGALIFARKLKALNDIVRPIYARKGISTET